MDIQYIFVYFFLSRGNVLCYGIYVTETERKKAKSGERDGVSRAEIE